MRQALLIFFSFLLLSSCSRTSNNNIATTEIDLFNNTVMVDDLKDYIQDIDVIRFRNGSSPLFINPKKVLLTNNGFIILSGGQVFSFTKEGEYIGPVGRTGNGPGEYISILDICLNDPQNEIWCLNHQNTVLKYNLLDLSHTGTIDSNMRGITANAIVPYNKSGFALVFFNPVDPTDFEEQFYCIKCFDSKGVLKEELFPREDFNISISFMSPSIQSQDNNYCLCFSPSSGTFWESKDGQLSPFMSISLGEKALPYRFAIDGKNNPWDRISDIFNSDYYKCVSSLSYSSSLYYCCAFGQQSALYNFIVDKETGKGIRWRSSRFIMTMPVIAADKEGFYFAFGGSLPVPKGVPRPEPDILLKELAAINNIDLENEPDPFLFKVRFKIK